MSSKTPNTVSAAHFVTPPRQPISTPKSSRSATLCTRTLRRLNTPSSTRRTPGDRFIPNRAATDVQFSSFKVNSAGRRTRENTPVSGSPSDVERRKAFSERLFSLKGCNSETRVLNFKQTPARCSSSGKNSGKCNHYKYYTPPPFLTNPLLAPIRNGGEKFPFCHVNSPHQSSTFLYQTSHKQKLYKFFILSFILTL